MKPGSEIVKCYRKIWKGKDRVFTLDIEKKLRDFADKNFIMKPPKRKGKK